MNHVKDGKTQSNENVGNDVEMENNTKTGGSELNKNRRNHTYNKCLKLSRKLASC